MYLDKNVYVFNFLKMVFPNIYDICDSVWWVMQIVCNVQAAGY